VGDAELTEDPRGRFSHFVKLLESGQLIRLRTHVFQHTEHMGTAFPSFEQGLEFTQEK
jgi:hypothetical protein